jgi:hypothetical protein
MVRTAPRPILGAVRIAKVIIYWLAVVAISIALVIALILFFESRDRSSVGAGVAPASSA